MKRFFVLALLPLPLLALAQDSAEKGADDPFAALMKPSRAHAALEPWIGDWEVARSVWKTPGARPEVARGQAKRRWLHGKRYVHETIRFAGAAPFTTEAFYGHNNWSKRYQMVFMASNDTALYTYEGRLEDGVLSLTGRWSVDQQGASFEVKTRITTRHPKPDEEVIEIVYEYPGGRSHKAVEYRYRRAQK